MQDILLNPDVALEQQSFMTKVYGWMALALALTAGVAWMAASSPAVVRLVLGNMAVFFGLMIGELVLVVVLTAALHRMSAAVATMVFLLYSALNGLTLSMIFLAYTSASIALTFFVTAGTFGVMTVYGYVTKNDLTSWGGFLFMALIGLILGSVANLFFRNETFYYLITYAGIFIFIGLTAYDTQKIKQMGLAGGMDGEVRRKGAILGALKLYLDFINLFLLLLRLLGRRR